MRVRLRPLHVIAGLVLLAAAGIALSDDGGLHGRTTDRLLSAFKELSAESGGTAAKQDSDSELMIATFGTGCFWCTEAVFEQLEGVKRVVSGYSGGHVPNPTYQQVLTKLTGHAESVHIEYDPRVISYKKLLEVFWFTHDPTTLNQQGPDKGPQYRSVIFYHNDEQRALAEAYKKRLDESKAFRNPIVTEITKFSNFYPAENYHQDYFALNGRQPYCRMVIRPKVQKFRKVFREELKN